MSDQDFDIFPMPPKHGALGKFWPNFGTTFPLVEYLINHKLSTG